MAVLLALVMVAVGLVSMLAVSRRNAPVWDEVHFYGIGYYYLKTHQFNIPGAGIHPPASYYLNSVGLLGRDIPLRVFDPLPPGEQVVRNLGAPDPDRGNRLLAGLGFEPFFVGRVPFILAWAGLGVLVFLWSRQAFGPADGLLSLALYLLCPNLAAHGHLMTTDFLVSALIFASLFLLAQCLLRPGTGVLVGLLACLSLAPAVKLTGLMALPLLALSIGIFSVFGKELKVHVPFRGTRAVGRPAFLLYWACFGVVAAAALYLVFVALYLGDFSLRALRVNVELVALCRERGHAVLLDGEISRHGFARFYLLAILYKTPTAALVAWMLSMVLPRRGRRCAWAVPVGLALGFGLLVSFSGYTLGLRYALVVFPLLYVAAGRFLLEVGRASREARLRAGLAFLLVLACLAEHVQVWPFPRSYMNPLLVRGPKCETLADTDLDWGEGLFALRDFMREKGIAAVPLSYNGSVWPEIAGVKTSWYENPLIPYRDLRPFPRHGLFVISATNLGGLYFDQDKYAWLRRETPLRVLGGALHVYDLDRLPRFLDGTPRPRLP
ncbi:MAG: hypothetical protein KA419_03915 [Acidobacteria bacterium]|nr:hypothetical protein [Acidobacteriota bacterium]